MNSVTWNYLEADARFRYRQKIGAVASTWTLVASVAIFATVVVSFGYYDHHREAMVSASLSDLEKKYDEKADKRRQALRLTNDTEVRDATLVGKIEVIRGSGAEAMRLYAQVGSVRPRGAWLNRIDVAAGRVTVAGGAHSVPDAVDYYGDLAKRLPFTPSGLPKFEVHPGPHPYVLYEFVFEAR